ncbi:alpha/beta fold hydrolase [Pyxidicoccus parkwayensis]|uniref:Alpha/beta fold hydrolase n=1 Tax=Pyxidicoccus parkwayensis TaxID=2813578 RepID=A0ABX7NXU0_9BACT|nr:alpha/beta fold hydrolase [Pyxidicoccus parkwaysis]QSQ22255.1 alpha/beta fold hydrolase [Pyxidicoccus parkwaysis]
MSHAAALEQTVGPAAREAAQDETNLTVDIGPGVPFPIQARDGYTLSGTCFPNAGAELGGVVVISSAMGVRKRYYSRFAAYLARRGLPTITFDYRGIGGSRPATLKGFGAKMEDFGALDLAGVIDAVHERFPGRRMLVVGHSAGGQLLGLADNAKRVTALLTVASGSGYYKLFPQRLRMELNWRVLAPLLVKAFGKLPGWAGTDQDLPAGVAEQWARWCLSPQYLLSEGGEPRREAYASLYLPLRAYSFTDDPIASPEAVRDLLGIYADALVDHRLLSPKEVGRPIGHFGFFREDFHDSLWADAADWLADKALSPRYALGA